MKWTKAKPIKDGFYWAVSQEIPELNDGGEVVQVYCHASHISVYLAGSDMTFSGDQVDLWSGPLSRPEKNAG